MIFCFSLQQVLNLREQQSQESEMRVEYAKKIIVELKKMINEERDNYFSDREELNKCVKETQMYNITLFERSLIIRQGRIIELLDNLRSCNADLEVYEQTLIQSRRNQKIIENLKDIKEKNFRLKIARKEQEKLDEAGSQRFLRSQKEDQGEE